MIKTILPCGDVFQTNMRTSDVLSLHGVW